jgi:hypothetical protein
VEEGPSSDKLRLEISGIAYGSVETLDHTNSEIPKRQNCRCITGGHQPVVM